MLVIRREKGQSIRITDTISVSVVEVHEDRVRLGICVPKPIQFTDRKANTVPSRRSKNGNDGMQMIF